MWNQSIDISYRWNSLGFSLVLNYKPENERLMRITVEIFFATNHITIILIEIDYFKSPDVLAL